jgi:argininosuccinate lyase
VKLWEKGIETNDFVNQFTVGKDRDMDLYLAPYDVIGSIAHVKMLKKINLMSNADAETAITGLREIYTAIESGNFSIDPGIEDIHSQVEYLLTSKYGESGKKIHSGRSRNDQVLLDLKLFIRDNIFQIADHVNELFTTLQANSEKFKEYLVPGYTHLQIAMPSSFGLWFGAYAESLSDDLIMLEAAFRIANQNPLGSAAGYGSSFPLDREYTTRILGFDSMNYNVVYAQMGRGKTERIVSQAISSIASTLSKMSMDICLFNSQNFNFLSLPDEFTTGSSIMPHKKNPDVFELVRAKCNKLIALPNEIIAITNNLPSGYFRDLQMLKESFLPSFSEIIDCLKITNLALKKINVRKNIMEEAIYKYTFSVEELNKKVLNGTPFRDAYKEMAQAIQNGSFYPDRNIHHTHEGSIGNLCTMAIKEKFTETIHKFPVQKINKCINKLIES